MEVQEKRLDWIDALKGFGIFVVTCAQLDPLAPVEQYLYSFHMFLFIFISGYLYKGTTDLKKYISKKFIKLLIPYFVWAGVTAAIGVINNSETELAAETKIFILGGKMDWNAPIWYLAALFLVEIIYACLTRLFKSNVAKFIICIASAVLWILWFYFSGNPMPLFINLLPFALLVYSFGNLLSTYNVFERSNTITYIILAVSGILSVVFGLVLNIQISYITATFGNIYHCIIAGLAGSVFYFLVFKQWHLIGKSKILCKVGKNSLIIMCTQYMFFMLFDYISNKIAGISIWHTTWVLKAPILAAITIAIIISFVDFFKWICAKNKLDNVLVLFGIR